MVKLGSFFLISTLLASVISAPLPDSSSEAAHSLKRRSRVGDIAKSVNGDHVLELEGVNRLFRGMPKAEFSRVQKVMRMKNPDTRNSIGKDLKNWYNGPKNSRWIDKTANSQKGELTSLGVPKGKSFNADGVKRVGKMFTPGHDMYNTYKNNRKDFIGVMGAVGKAAKVGKYSAKMGKRTGTPRDIQGHLKKLIPSAGAVSRHTQWVQNGAKGKQPLAKSIRNEPGHRNFDWRKMNHVSPKSPIHAKQGTLQPGAKDHKPVARIKERISSSVSHRMQAKFPPGTAKTPAQRQAAAKAARRIRPPKEVNRTGKSLNMDRLKNHINAIAESPQRAAKAKATRTAYHAKQAANAKAVRASGKAPLKKDGKTLKPLTKVEKVAQKKAAAKAYQANPAKFAKRP